MEEYKVVGTFSQVKALSCAAPELNLFEYEQILEGRTFSRWYAKNRKMVDTIAAASTFAFMTAVKVSPVFLFGAFMPAAIPAVAATGTFFSGHGVILLHMLIIGFLTMVVTTFLKFTGRGDLAPLVMFVGGAVILYECMNLFSAIYHGVQVFFHM